MVAFESDELVCWVFCPCLCVLVCRFHGDGHPIFLTRTRVDELCNEYYFDIWRNSMRISQFTAPIYIIIYHTV